jgi:hypothetical protein
MFSDEEIFKELESASVVKEISQYGEGGQRGDRSAALRFDRSEGMYIEKGATYRFAAWIPEWTRDNDKLRQVLAVRNQNHAQNSYNDLSPAQLKGIPLVQLILHEKHQKSIARPGGYAALQAAIAYRSWREGMHAKEVAATLGVSANMVRQCLFRMRDIARKLEFETEQQRHWSYRTTTNHKRKPSIKLRAGN